jgi:hypothetical protein
MFYIGVGIIFGLIFRVIGYWPSSGWLWVYGLIGLYLAEEIWQAKIEELKRRMQELADRLDDLETRIPKPHPLANHQS